MREGRALGGPAESGAATAAGPGRVLVAVYGTFALAAGARATVQLVTRFGEAPVAYLLSALAAVVYVVATVALARGARRTAFVAITTELIGVLVVGTFSQRWLQWTGGRASAHGALTFLPATAEEVRWTRVRPPADVGP